MQNSYFSRLSIFAASVATAAFMLGGCSDGGGGGGGVVANPDNNPAATQAIVTPSADGNVQAKIGGVTINSPPVVTFALSDENGNPIDPTTTGMNLRFLIARLDNTGNYQSYIGNAAGQPTAETPKADGSQYKTVKPGVYQYTFATDITDSTKTWKNLTYDTTKTHTVAIQAYRTITRNGKNFTQILNPYFNFRPDGEAVDTVRELTPTSACIKCHGKLEFHGSSSRQEIAVCILCHTPGAIDPDTGNSIDMKDMIHKIHMGHKLPSVEAGAKYAIRGNSFSYHDYSPVKYSVFSADEKANMVPMDCSKCHTKGTDTLGNAYNANESTAWQVASKENCSTCHDTTTFDGSTTITVNNPLSTAKSGDPVSTVVVAASAHSTTTQPCATCHAKTGTDEYVISSVTGAHTVWEKSTKTNKGIVAKVLSATNVGYGLAPKVRIQVTDAKGAGIAPGTANVTLGVYGALKPVGVPDFFNTTLTSGNAQIHNFAATATSTTAIDVARGIYDVNVTTPLPSQAALQAVNNDPSLFANGATVMFTINAYRSDVAVPRRTTNPQAKADMPISVYYDLATGLPSTDERRTTIDEAKCKNCHNTFIVHSGRPNGNNCVICHTPTRNDENYAFLIHKYHRGKDQAENKFRRYIVVEGDGSEGASARKVAYVNNILRCDACHTSDNPEPVVSLPAYSLGGNYSSGFPSYGAWVSNSFNHATFANRIPSVSASCVSCHDSDSAMTHIKEMVVTVGSYPYFTENCTSCHTAAARKIYHQLPR